MHRNLTVSEVLYYQAMLRLPVGIRTEGIKKKINQVILDAYTEHKAHIKHPECTLICVILYIRM
jgi:hypothetical protein